MSGYLSVLKKTKSWLFLVTLPKKFGCQIHSLPMTKTGKNIRRLDVKIRQQKSSSITNAAKIEWPKLNLIWFNWYYINWNKMSLFSQSLLWMRTIIMFLNLRCSCTAIKIEILHIIMTHFMTCYFSLTLPLHNLAFLFL